MKKLITRPIAFLLSVVLAAPTPTWANPSIIVSAESIHSVRFNQEALASLDVWQRLHGAIPPLHEIAESLSERDRQGVHLRYINSPVRGAADGLHAPLVSEQKPNNSPSGVGQRIAKAMNMDIYDQAGQLKTLDALREEFAAIIFPAARKMKDNSGLQDTVSKYASGIALIPLLAMLSAPVSRLGNESVLRMIDAAPGIQLDQISRHLNPENPEANKGYQGLMLEVLAQQGWISMNGQDATTQYALTEFGRKILGLAEKNQTVLKLAASSFEHSQNYYKMFRDNSQDTSQALDEYAELVRLSQAGWNLVSSQPDDSEAVEQLRFLLDGMIMCPTVIALGMPEKHLQDGQLVIVDSSFDEKIDAGGASPEPNAWINSPSYNKRFLSVAFALLASQKPLGGDRALGRFVEGNFQFTELGKNFFAKKGSFGVPGSYIRGSTQNTLRSMFFDAGNPDPIGIREHHNHVDQLVNAWGSHLANSVFQRKFLSVLLPLLEDGGVRGLSEMASAEGHHVTTLSMISAAWLKTVERVNGSESAQVPFVAVSSDYDRSLLPRQKAVFAELLAPVLKAGVFQSATLRSMEMRQSQMSMPNPWPSIFARPVYSRPILMATQYRLI